jgi:hypothetical protein
LIFLFSFHPFFFVFVYLALQAVFSDTLIEPEPVGVGTCSTAEHQPSPFPGKWYPALLAERVHPLVDSLPLKPLGLYVILLGNFVDN